LSAAGATVVNLPMAEFAQAAAVNPRGALTSAEAYWWHRRWLKDGADKYDPRVIVRIRAGETVTAATYIDLIKLRERFIRTISAAATGSDAMLMPTTPDTAPTIAEAKSATPVAAKSDDKPATRSAFPNKPSSCSSRAYTRAGCPRSEVRPAARRSSCAPPWREDL
jgi:Asp-tRNA(Asn)/Glu-tRNA(Gln) amidotransferase A subunit family amidase